jgi:4-amino-4-deoxy-L-arabinose transferase-like glycosyltransferase
MNPLRRPGFDRTAGGTPATIAIFSLFVLLTVTLAFHLNVWQDEAYSLHTTSKGLANALHQGIYYEAQAPLYFGILDLWRSVNGSVLFARLLSILFSLVTIGFTWRFAKRYIGEVSTSIVTAVVAFNPFMIWAAIEVRPYAFTIALSAAIIYYFFRGWIDDDKPLRYQAFYVILAIVAAYTQYYVAILVPAGFVALLCLRRFRSLRSYVPASIIVALAIAPLALVIPLQLKAYSANPFVVPRFAAAAIVLPVLGFLYPHDWVGSWAHRPLPNALYMAAVLVPAVLAFRRVSRYSITTRVTTTLVAVMCIIFAILIGPGHISVIWPRQTAALFVPTIFAAFALIADISQERRRTVLRAFLTVYVIFTSLALWSQYHGFSKDGDWRRVGAFLSANVVPTDAVAVFDAEAELPLRYYFNTVAVTPIPKPIAFDHFDESDFIIRDDAAVRSSLGEAAQGHSRLWLVLNDVCDTGPKFYGCSYLKSYIAHHFKTMMVAKFNRSSVLELAPLSRPKVSK